MFPRKLIIHQPQHPSSRFVIWQICYIVLGVIDYLKPSTKRNILLSILPLSLITAYIASKLSFTFYFHVGSKILLPIVFAMFIIGLISLVLARKNEWIKEHFGESWNVIHLVYILPLIIALAAELYLSIWVYWKDLKGSSLKTIHHQNDDLDSRAMINIAYETLGHHR